jgi:hypothetical protein
MQMSVAAIVAGVQKAKEMVDAEREIVNCQQQLDALEFERREVAAELERWQLPAARREVLTKRSREIGGEISRLSQSVTVQRRIVDDQAPAYGRRVHAALIEMRQREAKKIINAVDAITAAFAILSEAHAEIRRAGASSSTLFPPLLMDVMRKSMEDVLTECDQAARGTADAAA